MQNNQDWQNEVDNLNLTISILEDKVRNLKSSIDDTKKFVEELRQYYIKGTEIFGDVDEAERVGVQSRIDDLVAFCDQNIEKIIHLERNKARPYFGRVHFVTNDDDIDFYIGLTSLDHNNKYYVYDWRAPICELFYDFGLGKASFKAPNKTITGNVVLKRQYDIKDGVLLDMYDKNENIFDDYLQKILKKVNTDKLHNIASTIQLEQNEIIRDLKNNFVIVQGYAGSGKTTIALHKIAYDLYRQKNLKATNILIFTLNEAFLSHIDGVLPELGEENTRSADISKFAGRFLKIMREFEDMDLFLNRYLDSNAKQRKIIKDKLDLTIIPAAREWVISLTRSAKAIKGFKLHDVPFSVATLDKMYNIQFCDVPYLKRFDAIAESIAHKFKLDKNDIAKVQIRDKVLECFGANINLLDLYTRFCVESKLGTPDLSTINIEDAILLCWLKYNLDDINIRLDIKQIVIDEAQEYPAIFLKFLFTLFPRAQFTILGDKYQQTNPLGIGDLEQIKDLQYIGESKYYELQNTYRSSEEIVEYSSQIIGNPKHNAFRLKSGNAVVEQKLADNYNQILSILETVIQDEGNIGIVTGSVESAREITNILNKVCPNKVCLVEDAKSNAYAQIQVMPVSLSKGLEFNTVIVVKNGGLFDSVLGQNLFYIACTRAINKLIVLK